MIYPPPPQSRLSAQLHREQNPSRLVQQKSDDSRAFRTSFAAGMVCPSLTKGSLSCNLTRMSSVYRAPAKINLSLRVKGKRADGYHDVDIIMAKLDLADELDFHNSRTTTLLCEEPGMPTDESNLVMRAILEFEKHYGRKAKQRISLTKHIPHAAGLGGGSSDAATTLLAVNEILGTQYSPEELSAMAAAVGSDVPFFLNPVLSRCTGRGEQVRPLVPFASWTSPIVLIKPGFGVATAEAYQKFIGSRRLKNVMYDVQTVKGLRMSNDLERPVFSKFPILAMMKMWMLERPGVNGALMSGSGSSLFALTETPEQACQLAADAREYFGDASLFTYCGTVNPQ